MTDNGKSFDRLLRRVEVVLAVMFLGLLGLGVWSVFIQENTNRLSRDTKRLSVENRTLLAEQKQSRDAAILLTCKEQNKQHDETRAGLKVLVRATAAQQPARSVAAAHQQQHFFNVFVAAIKPRYDCKKRLVQLTRP